MVIGRGYLGHPPNLGHPASLRPDRLAYQSACSRISDTARSLNRTVPRFTGGLPVHVRHSPAPSLGCRPGALRSFCPSPRRVIHVPSWPGGVPCPGESTHGRIRWESPSLRRQPDPQRTPSRLRATWGTGLDTSLAQNRIHVIITLLPQSLVIFRDPVRFKLGGIEAN